MKNLKKQEGITLVALVVTIIVLIILVGVSINLVLGDNGIITIAKKAKENTELAKTDEEIQLNELYFQLETGSSDSGNLPYDSIAKLTEFKTAIANAIDEAGGVKPDISAETSIFADNIKGILKEVTKDATATADDILQGKTAYVNGELITGTKEDTPATSTITWKELGSVKGAYGQTVTGTFSCTNIPNYKNLTISNFTYKLGTANLTWKGYTGGNSYTLDASISNPTMTYDAANGLLRVSCSGSNNHADSTSYSGVYPGFIFYCIY